METTKQCNKCNTIKPLSEFYCNHKRNVYHNKCKVCFLEQSRNRYKENKICKKLLYTCLKCSKLKPAEGFLQNNKKSRFCEDCNNIILLESLTERQCTKCKFIKPIGEFFVNKAKKHGRAAACKECLKIYNKTRIVKKISVLEKKCYHCKAIKPINLFYKSANLKDGHDTNCIECRGILDKKYIEKRKEKIRLRKAYYEIFVPKYTLSLHENASSDLIEIKAFIRIINRSIKELI